MKEYKVGDIVTFEAKEFDGIFKGKALESDIGTGNTNMILVIDMSLISSF